jgi:4-amino-4-deoxy-L-arabinose transferase-like glycosyltransferase
LADRGASRWLVVVLVIAVVLRAALLIYAESRPQLFDFPDSHRYMKVAGNIAAGNGPIESPDVRAGTDPLYPWLLSLGVRLGASEPAALMRFGRLVNVLFSIASILLLAKLARRLVGERAALFAALLLAVDPILLFFNALVLTETCYITLLLASFLCIAAARDKANAYLCVAGAGICLGLGALLRSSALVMPLALAPFVWSFAGGKRSRRAVAVFLFAAAAAIPLLPTIARNYGLFGRIVTVRTGAGASLMEAWGPWADGGPGMDRIVYPEFPADADEYERDRLCRDAAIAWAKDNPGRVISLAWTKLCRTWSVTIHAADYSSAAYRVVSWLTVAPVFALALYGVWALRRRPWLVCMLLTPAVYFTLLHMVFVGSVRYRLPAVPFIFLLAGAAIDRLCSRVRATRAA